MSDRGRGNQAHFDYALGRYKRLWKEAIALRQGSMNETSSNRSKS